MDQKEREIFMNKVFELQKMGMTPLESIGAAQALLKRK
jgi:hypothetical protein